MKLRGTSGRKARGGRGEESDRGKGRQRRGEAVPRRAGGRVEESGFEVE